MRGGIVTGVHLVPEYPFQLSVRQLFFFALSVNVGHHDEAVVGLQARRDINCFEHNCIQARPIEQLYMWE
jgi:hypothetical protein